MVEILAQGEEEGKKKVVDANVAISALPHCFTMILNKTQFVSICAIKESTVKLSHCQMY